MANRWKEPTDEEMAARKAQWEQEAREPSPLPWLCRPHEYSMGDDDGERIEIVAADGEIVADNKRYYPQDIRPADARFIVIRVNAHDALVAALGLVRSMRTVEALAPAAYQSEVDKRREAWAKIDLEIDTALALARGGK